MTTRRDTVRGAQLLLRDEFPSLKADGLWGPKTDAGFVGASVALKNRVSSWIESAGWLLDDIRSAVLSQAGLPIRASKLAALAREHGIHGKSLANFLATVQAESQFRARREDHRYSVAKLKTREGFSGMPDSEISALIKRGPEAVFSVMYSPMTSAGKRLGNTEVDDGAKYYGRGHIMLTGRWNYHAFQRDTGAPVVANPDLLVTDDGVSMRSAIWFWKRFVESQGASSDIVAATRIVNRYEPNVARRVALAKQYSVGVV